MHPQTQPSARFQQLLWITSSSALELCLRHSKFLQQVVRSTFIEPYLWGYPLDQQYAAVSLNSSISSLLGAAVFSEVRKSSPIAFTLVAWQTAASVGHLACILEMSRDHRSGHCLSFCFWWSLPPVAGHIGASKFLTRSSPFLTCRHLPISPSYWILWTPALQVQPRSWRQGQETS